MAKRVDPFEGLDPIELDAIRADLEKYQRKLPKPGPSMADQAAAAAKGSVYNKLKRGAWRGMENLSRFGEGAAWLPIELLKLPGSIDQSLGGTPGFLQDIKRSAQNVQDELHHGTQFFQEMAGVPKEESALPTSERFIPTWVPETAGMFTQPGPYLSPIKKLLAKEAIKPALKGAGQMAAYGAGISGVQEFNRPADERDWMNVPKTAAIMGASSPVFQRLMGAFQKRAQPAGQPIPPHTTPPPAGPEQTKLPDWIEGDWNVVPPRPEIMPPVPSKPIQLDYKPPIEMPFKAPLELPYHEPPAVADAVAQNRGSSMRLTDLLPDDLNVNTGSRDPFLVKQPPKPQKSLTDTGIDALAGEVRPSLVKPHDMLPAQLEVNQGPRTPFLIKNPDPFFDVPVSKTIQTESDVIPPVSNVSQNKAFGESLTEFLRAKGGVQDQGGEISRFEIPGKPFQPGLIKPEGMGLDTAAELAQQAGYIPERDINALLQSIDREARGNPVFAPGKGNPLLEDLFQEQQFAKSREFRDPALAEFYVAPEEPIHPSDLPENVLPPLEDGWTDPTLPRREVSGGEPDELAPLRDFFLGQRLPPRPTIQEIEAYGASEQLRNPIREGMPWDKVPDENDFLAAQFTEQWPKNNPSIEDLHSLAESKGIAWDNNPDFMAMTERVTGKKHLDQLTPAQRGQVKQAIDEWTPDTAMGGGAPEHGGPAPDLPAGHEAATEVHQETQTDVAALDHIKNILNDERGSTHLGGGVGPIERVLTQRRFAEKHPQDFGPVYRKALDRFEWAAAQKTDLHNLGRSYFLLDPKDRKIVDQYLRDRRRNRTSGIPPSLKPAVDAVDRMMQSSYNLINDVLDVKGLPPMRHDPAYVPFARSGDYLTIATLPNGAKWVSAATTLREAEAMEKKLVGQFPGVNVLVKTTSSRKGDLPTLDFGTMALLEKAGLIDRADFEAAVQQFDLPPGFSAHMRNAQKILGESVDLLDPIERYIDGVTNYTARFLHDEDMKGMIEKITDPAVKQYAEKYREYINTKPQEYSRLRGAVAVWDLSLNIGSMIQNASQTTVMGFPILHRAVGLKNAAKLYADGWKHLVKPEPMDLAVLKMAEREGHTRPINAEELFGARGAPGQELQFGSPYVQRQIEKGVIPQSVGKGIRWALDKSSGGTEKLLAKGGDLNLAIGQKLSYGIHRLTGAPAPVAADKARAAHPVLMQGFASIEEMNRKWAIIVGNRAGLSKGMTPGEAYEYAKTFSRDVNFDYSPASRAQAFRGAGAPLGLFMTFQTEAMATYSKLIREQAKAKGLGKAFGPATTALLAFWAIGGIKGLPAVEDLDLYGPDPGMISQNLPDWLYQGPTSAATGRDFSAKFKIGPRVPFDLLHGEVDLSQVPIAQPFQNIGMATDWFLESPMDSPSVQKYIERLLPPAERHAAQAARWAGLGPAGAIEQGTVGTMRGHTPGPTEEGKRDFFHPSGVDIAGKAMTFTPLELSKQYTRGRIQQRMKDHLRTETTALVNSAAHHLDINGASVPSPALESLRTKHPNTYRELMKAHMRRQNGIEKGSTEEIYRKKQEPKVIPR